MTTPTDKERAEILLTQVRALGPDDTAALARIQKSITGYFKSFKSSGSYGQAVRLWNSTWDPLRAKAERRADAAEARVRVLEEALRFYADASNYSVTVGATGQPIRESVHSDRGVRARAALAAPRTVVTPQGNKLVFGSVPEGERVYSEEWDATDGAAEGEG